MYPPRPASATMRMIVDVNLPIAYRLFHHV
jgi:hypothetical protein